MFNDGAASGGALVARLLLFRLLGLANRTGLEQHNSRSYLHPGRIDLPQLYPFQG
jgi:hypothetical protein